MLALVRRSQSASIYWVAAIAPGPLPSYVTGLAPASPGQVLPTISAFQRHSTHHLLHCRSPSSFHLVPVCRQLQRAYYLDFARVGAPKGVPSGFVQRVLGVALAA